MKKTFTPELISAIVAETSRLISLIPADEAGQRETKVDGVDLVVAVRISEQPGFGATTRRTVNLTYGKMIIVYGINPLLLSDNISNNPLRVMLSSCLGARRERIDMGQLATMISQQSVAHAINSGSAMGYLTVTQPADFEVELPGGVVFSRTDKSLSVVRGDVGLCVISTTIPHVIEQHMNQAAHLAISYADDIIIPARTVDTSVDSVLANGVLYIKTGDKSVAFYFDDEHTKAFVAQQSSQHFTQGVILDPNQQFGHPFNGMRPGRYSDY